MDQNGGRCHQKDWKLTQKPGWNHIWTIIKQNYLKAAFSWESYSFRTASPTLLLCERETKCNECNGSENSFITLACLYERNSGNTKSYCIERLLRFSTHLFPGLFTSASDIIPLQWVWEKYEWLSIKQQDGLLTECGEINITARPMFYLAILTFAM